MSILLLLFIGAVIAFAYLMSRPTRLLNDKLGSRLVIGYFSVLIIAAAISGFIPIEDDFSGEVLSSSEMEDAQMHYDTVYRLAHNGNIDEVDSELKRQEWEFEVRDNKLKVQNTGSHYIPVFVEVKGEGDRVRAAHYAPKSLVSNIDISKEINSPKISMVESALRILPPEQRSLVIAKVSQPFPFNQFSEDRELFGSNMGSAIHGGILYIEVPQGVEVTGEVTFVGY